MNTVNQKSLVYVSLINSNSCYIDLARYWILSLKNTQIENYIIYCSDIESFNAVKKMGGKARYITEPRHFQNFSVKLSIIEELSQEFDSIVYCDIDAVFLKDPNKQIISLLNDYDVLFSTAIGRRRYPRDIAREKKFVLCGGFFSVNVSSRLTSFLKSVRTLLNDDLYPDFQTLLNKKIELDVQLKPTDYEASFLFEGLQFKLLSQDLVKRGKTPDPQTFVLHILGRPKQALNSIKSILRCK
jgi:hypothetical protein